MDITHEQVYPNPRDKANPLSIIFFSYTIGIFRKGYSKDLEAEDLYNPLKSDRSTTLGDRLEKKWEAHLKHREKLGKKPSLGRVLVSTFWPEYLYLGVLLCIMDLGVRLIQPIYLGYLLDYFRPNSVVTQDDAMWYAGAVVGMNAFSALFVNQYIMNAFHYGMKVRAACCALIYRKALRLSKTALGETASGKIVNLLSNDVSRFDIVSVFIHHMWVAPASTLFVMYFLWTKAGYAGIIGIIPVFLVVPFQSYTGKLSAKYRKQTAMKTDERVRLMDEIITGVQVIKMYAWEKPFAKLIKFARKAEIKIITKSSYVRGIFMTFNLFTTRVALFCTLITMSLTDQPITAAKIFVFMSYYSILSQTMSSMFVRGISEIAELFVAINRLQEFLNNEEFLALKSSSNNNDIDSKTAINMKNASVKWNLDSTDLALDQVNLNIPKGRLLGIIGLVGAGKSSLLQTILGEIEVVDGSLDINGTISYASQEPWIFAATVRQNITFGAPYDKKKYNDVIHVCALEKDFKQFPDGDLTIVGDRGASLSGGQKARINLARAVYRDADIYLLDDPLSAVDVHVATHLFDKCINGYLKDKTRILVTHQVYLLKNVDNIIILNNGRVDMEGSFDDLSKSDNLYAQLCKTEPEQTPAVDEVKPAENIKMPRKMSTRSATISMSELSIPDSVMAEENVESDEDEPEIKYKDLQEQSSKGKVEGSLFMRYMIAGSNICLVTIVFLLFMIAQIAASGVDYFVSFWVNIEESRNKTESYNSTMGDVTSEPMILWTKNLCIYVYTGLIVGLFVFALTRSLLFYKLAMKSSQKLHDQMFSSVIGAKMRFFDTNPSGRILNRFSKDIGGIDELLPKTILDAGQIMLTMGGSLVLVTIVNAYFLILVLFVGAIFMLLRHIFLKSSKSIKRLEGIMKGPVFTHLNATLQGLTTIRAYRAEAILKQEFDKHQDLHSSAWFMYIALSSAFGFYSDVLCFFFVAFITFSLLLFGDALGLKGGDVGLAITQATALTGLLQWGMRQSAEVINQLMSVERVLEYEELPKETESEILIKPPSDWPNEGHIYFEDMGLKYIDDGALVLRDLNIEIKPKEKVGIVGRTGAGKSSLISALFRLATVEGKIVIDDVDTKDLSLFNLRSKISIIPQDPVLFSGTLRYNLDPFEEYPDEVLYKAINEVELKDPANINNRLENRVMDRGSNYSVGQRQLICLARAIIRNNKILMLDEATANVDPQTDGLIQKTIRKKFADCTVLTVAHRLNTIMDSDKVLVMEGGHMVEYDHPYTLLQNTDSVFSKMVAETGKTTCEQLKKVAYKSYQRQISVPEIERDL